MNDNIIILGILLSIFFYEICEFSPGGLIVPGYLALYLNNPSRIIATFFIALISFFIIRFLENYIILFGRRKFAFYIIITFFLKLFFKNMDLTTLIGGEIIGILIPSIIAQDIDKNGIFKTIPATLLLSLVIKSIYILCEGLL